MVVAKWWWGQCRNHHVKMMTFYSMFFFSQELSSDSLLPYQPRITIEDALESTMQQDRMARQFTELRSCWSLLEDHLNRKDTEVQHVSELHQQFSNTIDRINASLDTIELQLSDVNGFHSDAEETLKSNEVSSFLMRIAWNCVWTMAFYNSPIDASTSLGPTSTLILHSFWMGHSLFRCVISFAGTALQVHFHWFHYYYNIIIVALQLSNWLRPNDWRIDWLFRRPTDREIQYGNILLTIDGWFPSLSDWTMKITCTYVTFETW